MPISFKGHAVDRELRDLVTMMVNAFLRPGDLFKIKNSHIDIIDEPGDDGRRFLRIRAPASKGNSTPTVEEY